MHFRFRNADIKSAQANSDDGVNTIKKPSSKLAKHLSIQQQLRHRAAFVLAYFLFRFSG